MVDKRQIVTHHRSGRVLPNFLSQLASPDTAFFIHSLDGAAFQRHVLILSQP
jgi:hypothetical protein